MSDELVMEVQPMTLLAPTGELRWVRPYKVIGDLFSQTKLQQKWVGYRTFSAGTVKDYAEEWRDVPVIMEERT